MPVVPAAGMRRQIHFARHGAFFQHRRDEEIGAEHESILDRASGHVVHRGALERGLKIPGDCDLVSIDGTPLNAWVAPWLKSIEIPYAVYGAEIVAGLQLIWRGDSFGERLLPWKFG